MPAGKHGRWRHMDRHHAQTNDPTALVATPIVTHVRFDGSTLAMENDYGQAAVWRKQ